jgi:hypothetical protein
MLKKSILVIAGFFPFFYSGAQLITKTECNTIIADIYKGWINEVKPNADPEFIKAKLPCFTSFEKEGNESKCGGGVYYADKGFMFMVQRDFLVITDKFKGKLTLPLMGAKQEALFASVGNPKLKDAGWEAYQMQYGTLILYFNSKKAVNKIIMSTKSTEEIQLCAD